MLVNTKDLLIHARSNGYAVGAFNIYNMEGAVAVIDAARTLRSPVILQILPSALHLGGITLVNLCCDLARRSPMPAAVHLDHCDDQQTIFQALDGGITSVMADGSGLEFADNVRFTREIVLVSRSRHPKGSVEGELGRLRGDEEGLQVAEREARLTSVGQAVEFVSMTEVDALAVCIGNVHGTYHTVPELDFDRLAAIADRVSIPLVLHGTSGLPDDLVRTAISHGVSKFNVNSEVRSAYTSVIEQHCAASGNKIELVLLLKEAVEAMKTVVSSKIRLFGSAGSA